MTPEEHLALASMNPEFYNIIKNLPPSARPSPDTMNDIFQLRAYMAKSKLKAQLLAPPPPPEEELPYIEADRRIPVHDGAYIRLRIHSPKTPPKDGCPIFVVYHGGGYCLGDLDSEATLCRKFTELGGVAVNVEYRLAPESPFPIPVLDAYDALKWTSQHFEELGGNPKKGFLVGGVSSGANFATVISHLYRDDKLSPPLTGVYLAAPPIVSANSVPRKYKSVWLSREQNKNATLLNVESIRMFDGHYDPDWESPLFCPLLFESHKNLPPTYFQVCGMDPFRDDGFIYERVLREENGIKTKIDVYPGLPHVFWTFFKRAGFTKKLYEDSVKGLAWLLEQSVTNDIVEKAQSIGSPKSSRTATETAEAESTVDKLQATSVIKGNTATRKQKEEGTTATSSSAANYADSEGGLFSRALYRCPEIMELMRLIVKKNPGDLSSKVKSFVDSLKEEEAWKRQNTQF